MYLARAVDMWRNRTEWKIFRDFFNSAYQRQNMVRLQHLDSLGLDIQGKTVLEIGAGVGDHTLFYLYRNCQILPTDGRPELMQFVRDRFAIPAKVIDADREPEKFKSVGHFDLIHCYGLLYHLNEPGNFLAQISSVGDCLLLETLVSFGEHKAINRVTEAKQVLSQSIYGQGCRPTRPWIFDTLKQHYKFVYCSKTQPDHEQFPLDWREPFPKEMIRTRAVFVASQYPINNDLLVDEIPSTYERYEGLHRK